MLEQVYPNAVFQQNTKEPPRKGSFEVFLILTPSTSPTLLFSKLNQYGPAKNKSHLPDPISLVKQISSIIKDGVCSALEEFKAEESSTSSSTFDSASHALKVEVETGTASVADSVSQEDMNLNTVAELKELLKTRGL